MADLCGGRPSGFVCRDHRRAKLCVVLFLFRQWCHVVSCRGRGLVSTGVGKVLLLFQTTVRFYAETKLRFARCMYVSAPRCRIVFCFLRALARAMSTAVVVVVLMGGARLIQYFMMQDPKSLRVQVLGLITHFLLLVSDGYVHLCSDKLGVLCYVLLACEINCRRTV